MSQQVFIAGSIEVAPDPRRGRVVPSSRKRSPSDYFRRPDPALSHRADRQRSVAFGETAPGRVGHQIVVTVARGRQVQRLQNAMDMRRRRQIFTTRDQSHPLDRVVDGNGQVIARRHVLTGENNIAERSGIRQLQVRPVLFFLDPFDGARQSKRAGEIEPQGKIDPCALLLCALARVDHGTFPGMAVPVARAVHRRLARSRRESRDACKNTDR